MSARVDGRLSELADKRRRRSKRFENDWKYRLELARDYLPEKVFLSLLAMDPRARDALRVHALEPLRAQLARMIFGAKRS